MISLFSRHAKIVYGKKSYRLELHRESINDALAVIDMKTHWKLEKDFTSLHVWKEQDNSHKVLDRHDAEVKEASETGNSGKQLLSVTENDVQTKTEPLTPPCHKTLEMKNEVKAEQEMEESVHNDFHPLMYEHDLLQKEDPVNYQQDPYHGEDEAEENAELFDDQDHLLEHVPFLKETVVIVYGNALLLVVDAPVIVSRFICSCDS
ncbi:hypothetical protein Tco_1319067 [Tanacetum coccineum]